MYGEVRGGEVVNDSSLEDFPGGLDGALVNGFVR